MTIADKVEEITLDARQRKQVEFLMKIAYAGGMGNGAARILAGENIIPTPGYIDGEFESWFKSMPWINVGGL